MVIHRVGPDCTATHISVPHKCLNCELKYLPPGAQVTSITASHYLTLMYIPQAIRILDVMFTALLGIYTAPSVCHILFIHNKINKFITEYRKIVLWPFTFQKKWWVTSDQAQ